MLREDNTGFVNFPMEGRVFNKLQTGKTMVYLVTFDVIDLMNTPYDLSNTKLKLPGTFISDDVFPRKRTQEFNMSIDEMIENQIKENELDSRYFPNDGNTVSIPLTTCICLGWNEFTYVTKEDVPYFVTFRDLTNEGKKLYYSIKKLHNNKEVRILTFNCI